MVCIIDYWNGYCLLFVNDSLPLSNRYLKFYLPLFEVLLQIFLYHHIHLAQ